MATPKQHRISASQGHTRPYNPVVETARAATRPIVTLLFAGALVTAVVYEIPVPPWFLSLAIPSIAWWFGERTVQHVRDRKESKIPT